jgi:hypothetical protein
MFNNGTHPSILSSTENISLKLVDYLPVVSLAPHEAERLRNPRFLFTVHHLIGLSLTEDGQYTARVRLTREQFCALQVALEAK